MDIALMKPLLRKGKLTQNDWIEILEKVRETIAPKLERMKLKQFGDLACIDDGHGRYDSLGTREIMMTGGYMLFDHGIAYFKDTGERVTVLGNQRDFHAWGLAKDGKWVLISVTVRGVLRNAIQGSIREEPRRVVIQAVSLKEMLDGSKVTPFRVLSAICLEIQAWRNRKRLLYEDSENFSGNFEALRQLLLHGFLTPQEIL